MFVIFLQRNLNKTIIKTKTRESLNRVQNKWESAVPFVPKNLVIPFLAMRHVSEILRFELNFIIYFTENRVYLK